MAPRIFIPTKDGGIRFFPSALLNFKKISESTVDSDWKGVYWNRSLL
jgi:hypothetical protein